MWAQSLLSAKNRNLNPSGQRMDGYHILTSPSPFDEECVRMAHRVQKSVSKVALFIESSSKGIMIGRADLIGSVLGQNHDFSSELKLGDIPKRGREIRFSHVYYVSPTRGLRLPDISELLSIQKTDLEDILTKAHAGLEPISMPPTTFKPARQPGTDWDHIASEVEAGKSRGGLFHIDGRLIERFEAVADTMSNSAQKKTSWVETSAHPIAVAPKAHKLGFTVIGVITVGVALTGALAWHLLHRQEPQRTTSTRTTSR